MNWRHVALSLVISGFIIAGGCFALITGDPASDDPVLSGTVDDTDPANPYDKSTLVVGIDRTNTSRETAPMVRDALDYWENNSAAHAGYPITYSLEPNATDPDVEIVWVDEITTCDVTHNETILGCADIVTDTAPEAVTVRVETGYLRNGTVEVLKHELGHTLGLTHDDEPAGVMSARTEATPREFHLVTAIEWDVLHYDRETTREQVNRTLEYYEDWAVENMKSNVSAELVNENEVSTDRIDMLVRVTDDPAACDDRDQSSCGEIRGNGTDRTYLVTLADVREDGVGWSLGHHVGAYLGLGEYELPGVFRNNDPDHVYSDWWNDAE